ncbi:hypothetical protein C3Y87_00580 [Carbonactinospora thermoautotrophica]|uniref:hypothetical protein n=1 Tax=Carbonactinospora thermoautotrophica TaxID=1469144 RepID=UPI002270E6A4|nr:hypothetical protein [Carbonactinospora thermoautotrophica]MCX9189939.1 hypothetical protein [Carbonactinospora thermoautotrophica]
MAPDALQEGWALGAQQPPASAWPDAAEPARRGWSVEVDPQVYQPGPASPDEAFLAAQPRGWPGSDPALRGTDSEAGLPEQGVTGRPAGEDWARPGPAGRPGGWPAPDAQGGSGEWPADRPAEPPGPTPWLAAPPGLPEAGLPTARWEEPEPRQGYRAAGGSRRSRRRGPARRPAPGEPRGRRGRPKPKGFVKTTLVLVVALGTVLGLYQFQDRDSSGTAAVVDEVDPAAPFAGSPAESWAAGPAGIRVAEPRQAGSFSAQQVRTALDTAKKLLVAANLDPATLRGEYPAGYVKLLNPLQRAEFEQALKNPSGGTSPTAWVTRFNPSKSRLHGRTVKVQGEITYQAVKTTQLRVHADVMFVYPVRTGVGQVTVVTRIVVRRIVDLDFYLGRDLPLTVASPERMWSSFAGAACHGADGYIEPVLSSTDQGGGGVAARDPYDRSVRSDQQEGCGRVRGT